MPKMRTFKFTEGEDTKTVDAVSYKKAVKSYQSSSKGNVVHVEWPGSKGGTFEKDQKLPLGRSKKMRQISTDVTMVLQAKQRRAWSNM